MRIRVGIFMVLLPALAGALPSHAQMVSAEGEDIKWGANPALSRAAWAVVYRVWLPANSASRGITIRPPRT